MARPPHTDASGSAYGMCDGGGGFSKTVPNVSPNVCHVYVNNSLVTGTGEGSSGSIGVNKKTHYYSIGFVYCRN